MKPLVLAADILVADVDPDRVAIECGYRRLRHMPSRPTGRREHAGNR
jgi:hypothetical protein